MIPAAKCASGSARPVAVAIVVVVGLHVVLPAKHRVNPPWVLTLW